jgi:hypothetical protein
MREQVKKFLSNGASRRALLSAGAYIAGAYFGAVFPGGIEALHEAFQYAVAMNPFNDPFAQISALYEGAQYQAAAALHAVGEWFQGAGVELSQRAREQIEQARAFLGPTLDQARNLFLEAWRPIPEGAAMLRDQIRNAIPGQEAVITWTKDVGKAAFDLLRNAVEAYGIYEVGKKVYGRLFSRAKADLREQIAPSVQEAPEVTERSINLNLNTAIGGGAVADAALRDRTIRFEHRSDPTAGISALSSDKIIWVSDKFGRRLSNDLNALIADISDAPGEISLRSPNPTRLEDPVDLISDLSHRDRFPTINWGQSDLSGDRLNRMKCGSKINRMIADDLKNINLVIGENGSLEVAKKRPQAPAPDLMM